VSPALLAAALVALPDAAPDAANAAVAAVWALARVPTAPCSAVFTAPTLLAGLLLQAHRARAASQSGACRRCGARRWIRGLAGAAWAIGSGRGMCNKPVQPGWFDDLVIRKP
jgi:hypothetical protein